MGLTKVTYAMIETDSYTSAQISDKTSTANAVNKYDGLYIWDTTNHRLMRANGALATDVWWVVDGSTSVTPA